MKRRLPPLNALRAFEAAARLGRMNAAADELSVTPGAISRQVGQLEQHLNLQLFEGSKNKPQLTHAGRALLPALSSAFDQIQATVAEIKGFNRITLDVACFSTLMVKWLIPRLFDFNARHPEIEIRLQTTSRGGEPTDERVDVVIAVQKTDDRSNHALPLFAEQLGAVLAPSLATTISLRTPCLLNGKVLLQSSGRTDAWATWAAAIGINAPKGHMQTFEHYYFALESALGGLGIAVAPWHLVADDIRSGRLIAPFGFRASGLSYVAKRSQAPNASIDLFLQWLETQSNQFIKWDESE